MLKIIHFKKVFSIILSASILAACNNATSNANKADVLAVNMDTTLKPGEDIFQYANGGWIKNNPIPAEESQWGIGNLVLEENTKRLREISESAAKENAAKGTASQKIGDFWQAAMDTLKIEKDGLTWTNHVSDLKGWQSEGAKIYGVNSIPMNFLIDGNGMIIAKNLRGTMLTLEIEKLIKQ